MFGLQSNAVRVLVKHGFREDCKQAFKSMGIMIFPCQYIFENFIFIRQNVCSSQVHRDDYDTRQTKEMSKWPWLLGNQLCCVFVNKIFCSNVREVSFEY